MMFVPGVSGTTADQAAVPVAVPEPPEDELNQVTVESVLSSLAVPDSVTVAVAVLIDVGPVGVTVGSTESKVTTSTSVAVFPAVSVAVTVIVLTPTTSGTEAPQEVVPTA